jgi:polar amino acid transport system substrate-binding protein
MHRALLVLICAPLALVGCGLPRDAAGTLRYVRGGTMRVGIVANRPWVVDRGDTIEGVEGRLVTGMAASLGARIEWVRLPEFELIRALHRRELHLGIGGFDAKVPWAQEVALTRPYLESPDGKAHVLAAPPGENAWLVLLDRTIEARKAEIPSLLAEAVP